MTAQEFERAQEITTLLANLQAERAAWASVGIDQSGELTMLKFIIGTRPVRVPNNVAMALKTNMLRSIDTQVTELQTEFDAL